MDAARETGRLPANVRPNFPSLFHLNFFCLSIFFVSVSAWLILLSFDHLPAMRPSSGFDVSDSAVDTGPLFFSSFFFFLRQKVSIPLSLPLLKMGINKKGTYQYMKSRAGRHKCQNHNQQKVKPKPETYQSVSQRLKVAYNWNANGNITSSWHLFLFSDRISWWIFRKKSRCRL